MKVNAKIAAALGAGLVVLGLMMTRSGAGAKKIPASQADIERQEQAGVYVNSYNNHPADAGAWV